MKICPVVVAVFVLLSCSFSSHASQDCDITVWHMAVMEHLLTQETEMTQRQMSILAKIEQKIERVINDGETPLVNCALLKTYSYNLIPEISSQLMDRVIQETHHGGITLSSDKSLHNTGKSDSHKVNGYVEPIKRDKNGDSDPTFENKDDINDQTKENNIKNVDEGNSDVNDIKFNENSNTKSGDIGFKGNNNSGGDMRSNTDVQSDGGGTDNRVNHYDTDNNSINSDEDNYGSIDTADLDDSNKNRADDEIVSGTNSYKNSVDTENVLTVCDRNDVNFKSDRENTDTNNYRDTVEIESVDNEIVEDDVDTKTGRDKVESMKNKKSVDTNNYGHIVDTKNDTNIFDKQNDRINDDEIFTASIDINSDTSSADLLDFTDKTNGRKVVTVNDNKDIISSFEENDDNSNDDEEECYYRSASDFVCERPTRVSASDESVHKSNSNAYHYPREIGQRKSQSEEKIDSENADNSNVNNILNDESDKESNKNIGESSESENRQNKEYTNDDVEIDNKGDKETNTRTVSDVIDKTKLDSHMENSYFSEKNGDDVNIDNDDDGEGDKTDKDDNARTVGSKNNNNGHFENERITDSDDKNNRDVVDNNFDIKERKNIDEQIDNTDNDNNNIESVEKAIKKKENTYNKEGENVDNGSQVSKKENGKNSNKDNNNNNGVVIFYVDDEEDATDEQESHKLDDTKNREIDDVFSEKLLKEDNENTKERSDAGQILHSDEAEQDEISQNYDDQKTSHKNSQSLSTYSQKIIEETENYENFDIDKETKKDKKKSSFEQTVSDLQENRGQSVADVEDLKIMLNRRELEQEAKIQNLELMLVKLENRILTQSVNQQSDSSAFVNLENQILKLENELMRLSQNYLKLQEDNDLLKAQQRKSYLELEHFKTSPRNSKYPALADNSSNAVLVQQQARIGELSKLIQNQSAMAQMLHGKSEYLKEQNNKLFQIVMNQTALITSIMSKLYELGENHLQTKIQAEDFKAKLEKLKHTQILQQPISEDVIQKHKAVLKQVSDIPDFAADSSVSNIAPPTPKDLVSIILLTMTESPTASSPSTKLPEMWRCNGANSMRLCIFHTLVISNCTPFSVIQWNQCKNLQDSLILDSKNESNRKNTAAVDYNVNLPKQEHTASDVPGPSQTTDLPKQEQTGNDLSSQSQKPDYPGQLSPQKDTQRINSIPTGKEGTLVKDANFKENLAITTNFYMNEDENVKYYNKLIFETDTPSFILQESNSQENTKNAKKQQEKATESNILNVYLDLVKDAGKSENEVKNNVKSDVVQDKNVIPGDGSNDNVESKNYAMEDIIKEFNNGDESKHTSVSNIQTDKQDIRERSLLPEDEQMPSTTKNETNEKRACEPGDRSIECRDQPSKTKLPTDVLEVGPDLAMSDEINKSAKGKSEHRSKLEDSSPKNVIVNKANDKIASSIEVNDRRKAAAEALKTHEALHRKILYNPIYSDRPKDCYELYNGGQKRDGVNQIFVSGLNVYVSVFCDMVNGGWTILMKREDGLFDFYRNYEQYKDGFGAPRGEHYIGNEVIHCLTNQGHYSLKAELTDWVGNTKHALYDQFWLDGEDDNFRLHLHGYSGNAGDGLGKHNGMAFSTFDVDHDLLKDEMGGSCAKRFHGAGWYYKCYMSNIFGRYYTEGLIPNKMFDGIAWKPWLGPGYSLKSVVLAVRPFGAQ